jgi:hypothetical protein
MKRRWFRIELNPVPWAIGPLSTGRKGERIFPKIGRNQELALFQAGVKDAMDQYGVLEKETGKFILQFYYWRKIDEYKTPQARAARNHEADVTNLNKAIEDALQGTLYNNDKDTRIIRGEIVEQSTETEGLRIFSIEPAPAESDLSEIPAALFIQQVDPTLDDDDFNVWPPRS